MNDEPSVADQWRARHAVVIASRATVPVEAMRITDELPLAGQKVILETAPWALELDRVAVLQLDLFGLLDDDRRSLSDLGIWVFRGLSRRNTDMAERERQFEAWMGQCYDPMYRESHPEQSLYHAAFWLRDDQWLLTRFIAAKGLVRVEGVKDTAIVRQMETAGLIEIRFSRQVLFARPTGLGQSVAAILEREEEARWRIFGAVHPTAYWADSQGIEAKVLGYTLVRLTHALRKMEVERCAH